MEMQGKRKVYRHLIQADRDRLQALRDTGIHQKEIAIILGMHPSTISREIARNRRRYRKKKRINNKHARYEAGVAHHKAYVRRKYSKYQGMKINEDDDLRRYIVNKLKRHWNPDEIAGRMKRTHTSFYASKTAIYEWLRTAHGQRFCPYLYSQRYYRKKRKNTSKKVMIPNKISIESRPRGATNRTRYGHYEGDTMVSGKKTGSRAAIAVIYERKARYINAQKITSLAPQRFTNAMNSMLGSVVSQSLTLDNGIENRHHEEIIVDGYFCDAYSSFQKGGVEGGIKMMRRWIPKGIDLNQYSENDIKKIIAIINSKPRKILNYKTPSEVMVENNLFKQKIPVREIALRG